MLSGNIEQFNLVIKHLSRDIQSIYAEWIKSAALDAFHGFTGTIKLRNFASVGVQLAIIRSIGSGVGNLNDKQ